jgi:hypothetical protein
MPGLKLIINRKAEKENKKSLGFQKNGILEVYMVIYLTTQFIDSIAFPR